MSVFDFVNANQEAAYRRATDKLMFEPPKMKTCSCCRRPRSIRQFAGESKKCNQCRGKK